MAAPTVGFCDRRKTTAGKQPSAYPAHLIGLRHTKEAEGEASYFPVGRTAAPAAQLQRARRARPPRLRTFGAQTCAPPPQPEFPLLHVVRSETAAFAIMKQQPFSAVAVGLPAANRNGSFSPFAAQMSPPSSKESNDVKKHSQITPPVGAAIGRPWRSPLQKSTGICTPSLSLPPFPSALLPSYEKRKPFGFLLFSLFLLTCRRTDAPAE